MLLFRYRYAFLNLILANFYDHSFALMRTWSRKKLNFHDEYFLLSGVGRAMRHDSNCVSHPLYFRILKAEDVSEAFDDISYYKVVKISFKT